jgi:carboxyl-terminal processing protease
MFILSILVTLGSFAAGVFFYARFLEPARPLAPGLTGYQKPQNHVNQAASPVDFATFWEAWSFLDDQFYGVAPANEQRVYGAIRGMVDTFGDQHTAFIDPSKAAIMSENISGSFEGIGATVRLDEAGRLVIVDPKPEQPAFKAGLRPGDIVLQVDDTPLEGLNLYEAILLIRGPAGSRVKLNILREGNTEPFEITVERAKIELEVVQAEMLPERIGYIQLSQFTNGAAKKLNQEITHLLDQQAVGLILDLRGNPGGLLSEAVDVSSLFVTDGTIVVEKLKGAEEKIFTADGRSHPATETPLVVLVNKGSASASEIVAGALQDLDRATLMGETTFGKGSVQLPHSLADGSQLRVTIAEWLTPQRRQIHGQGIAPDVVVEMTVEDVEQQRDPQLEKAVEFLKTVSSQPITESLNK